MRRWSIGLTISFTAKSLKAIAGTLNQKISGAGFPDSKNVKEGAKRIKYHLDYMTWLLIDGAGLRVM